MMPILWAVLAFLWHWGWAASLVLGVYNLFHHAPAHARAGDWGGLSQAVVFILFCLAMVYFPAFRAGVYKVCGWVYRAVQLLIVGVKAAIEAMKAGASK